MRMVVENDFVELVVRKNLLLHELLDCRALYEIKEQFEVLISLSQPIDLFA
jgi:hypothetical protein